MNTRLKLLREIQEVKAKIKDAENKYMDAGDRADWGGCAFWDQEKERLISILATSRNQLKTLKTQTK